MDEQLEKLAELAHQQWSGWMGYMLGKCTRNEDGTVTMPVWAVERWTRQMQTPYEQLPEAEKESDREEARRVQKVIGESRYEQMQKGHEEEVKRVRAALDEPPRG